MKVIIASPYATDSLNGNTVTARRIASLLKSAGHLVELQQSSEVTAGDIRDADVMIALHAKKSAGAAEVFRSVHAERKLIIFMTGTDLYVDLPSGCPECLSSMGSADALVVSQVASIESVPQEFREKSHVVYKSIELPEINDDIASEPGLFTVVGHLRAVKQPFMAVQALGLIEADYSAVKVKSLGAEFDAGSAEAAREYESKDSRYEWLGRCEHDEAIAWMRRSVATINSSLSEGGANSVGESIMLGIPVLASDIEGNRGMLGNDYSGYFPVDDPQSLADLMTQVAAGGEFLTKLKSEVLGRQQQFKKELELAGWLELIEQ